jgi:multidrug resistance efflux pump
MSALPAPNADASKGREVQPAALPAPGLNEAIESWRARLAGAGVACRAVALHGSDPQFQLGLPETLSELAPRWAELCTQVQAGGPLGLVRADERPGSDLLVVSAIQLPDGELGAVGAVLAPPHNDRVVQLLLLSLGWLQLALALPGLRISQRATRLLELMGHVGAQSDARAAAQEWLNRSAAWAREEAGEPQPDLGLMLFEVRAGRPSWWVSADSAWTEKASPALEAAAEIAVQAIAEQQEVRPEGGWAMPVHDDGRVVAVLVARLQRPAGTALPEPALDVLRASLGLVEPLLRHWREADRPLWRLALGRLGAARRRLSEPGHLAWKLGFASAVAGLLVLLAVPVTDRVTANTVIEGRQRQLVTAPFDGFVQQVLVRPGAEVKRGQLLARLDDRELKLEQARHRGEREQAAGHLRQAMSDREASAVALALAEVQQAEAQLSLVEAKLARTDLVAPADGLLVSGDWVQQIGGPVETGKEMFEIASGQGYRVVLQVPDRDIARVHAGQTGTLRLTGQPHEAHEFRVETVTAVASVQDSVNGFRVEAGWVGQAPPLSPGMQGIGKIEVGRANLLTIWTRSSVNWLRLKLWSWW